MSLSLKIDEIELKVRQLAIKMENLQQENTQLRADNQQLNQQLAEQTQKIGVLKERLEQMPAVKEVEVEKVPESNGELRKQLDLYITEIEQCIEWLQNA